MTIEKYKKTQFSLNLNKQELKQIKQLDKNKEKQQKLEQNNKHKVKSRIFNYKKAKA